MTGTERSATRRSDSVRTYVLLRTVHDLFVNDTALGVVGAFLSFNLLTNTLEGRVSGNWPESITMATSVTDPDPRKCVARVVLKFEKEYK